MIEALRNWFFHKNSADCPAKKKLFIHAGTYKTGTTYFQNILYSNAAGLEKTGLLYPETGLGLHTAHNHHAHRILGIDIAAGRKNRFPEIIDTLAEAPHLKSALVSYEGFGHLPTIGKLLTCKPCFDRVDLHGILVFRPHIDFAISFYRELCQHVSFKGNLTYMMSKPGPDVHHHWQKTLEYSLIVKRWLQLTGPKNLHLLSYRRIRHDSAQKLLAITGHEYTLVPPAGSEHNPTLSAPTAELMRRMNRQAFNTKNRHKLAAELLQLDEKFPDFYKYCEITHDQAIHLEKNFERDRQFLKAYGFNPETDLAVGDNWRWGTETNMEEAVMVGHEALVKQLKEKGEATLANIVATALEGKAE